MNDAEWNQVLKETEAVQARIPRDRPKSHKNHIYSMKLVADGNVLLVQHSRQQQDGGQKGAMFTSSFSKSGSSYASARSFLDSIYWLPPKDGQP